MSMTVLVVGLGHCLFPIIGAMVANKNGVVAGTLLGTFIAIAIGSARYAVVDLIGVTAGFAIAWHMLGLSQLDQKDE